MTDKGLPVSSGLFRLDRIYVRGFSVREAAVHHGFPWSKISDHAPLSTTLVLK